MQREHTGSPPWTERLHGLGPVLGLVLLCVAGTLLNPDFASLDNAAMRVSSMAFQAGASRPKSV